TSSFRQSVTLKFTVIGILSLILLIPAGMIKNLILERERINQDVKQELTAIWGKDQTITGPYLTIPYIDYKETEDGIKEITHYLHIMPEKLSISGNIEPEIRKRGIYQVILYDSNLKFSGTFPETESHIKDIDPTSVRWKDATINIGIPDMRGIQEKMAVHWNDSTFPMNPGIRTQHIAITGVSTGIPLIPQKEADFSFTLDLNGSENLSFVPLGKETDVALTSNWQNPSFNGSFLPRDHTITKDGFSAKWKVLHLNRAYPQTWVNNQYDVAESAFGLSLLTLVDHYQKSYRSAKYAIMFIALTFLTFFFIEVLNKKLIHPIQYLLVGLALIVFYSLLTSLSEHMAFLWAYLISAILNIGLISLFGSGIFKKRKLTLTLASILIVLYVFLYTILQLMDYALLMGNIGLFIALALVMFFSRKIDWYGLSKEPNLAVKKNLPNEP
ncbi:MAG: cell envelope integrity protein CreD, partial [Bacteroidota bacterium]